MNDRGLPKLPCIASIPYLPALLILTLTFILPAAGETVFHYTSSTNCKITFEAATNEADHESSLQFKDCTMEICRKYDIGGGCKNSDTYTLEKRQCYWDCCRQEVFNFSGCEQYNDELQNRKSKSNRSIIIGLSVSLTGIFIAVLVFLIKYIGCCKSSQKLEEDNQDPKMKIKYCPPSTEELNWKDQSKPFSLEEQCVICSQKEAFIMHSCGKMFHLKCLPEINESWQCPHCVKKIRKMRVYCLACFSRSITIRVGSFQQLEEKIGRSYERHPDRECFQFMAVELDTERKLTVTTKG